MPAYGSDCSEMIALILSSAFLVIPIAILKYSFMQLLLACNAHGLQPDRSFPRPVQLRHNNTLPFAQNQISVRNLKSQRYAKHQRAHVGVGIVPVAVSP